MQGQALALFVQQDITLVAENAFLVLKGHLTPNQLKAMLSHVYHVDRDLIHRAELPVVPFVRRELIPT